MSVRIRGIEQQVRAGHLTATEVFSELQRAHEDYDAGVAVVRQAFIYSARRHLAETVEVTPSTPPALLIEYSRRCRAHLAVLVAAEPEL